MSELDAPDDPDALYQARGDVPISLPIMQGDVYAGITVPGLADELTTVAIVMHPCSMRAGASLRPKITVAAVTRYQRLRDAEWRTGHVNVMPLPGLRQTADWYAIDFREVAAVPNGVLPPRSRIAACSQQGILLLQQRYAFHLTRLVVPLANLNEVSQPVFTESELLTDWVDAALDVAADGADATVAEAERAFHAYLDEDDRRRRKRLQQPHLHADLRRECRREIAARYPSAVG